MKTVTPKNTDTETWICFNINGEDEYLNTDCFEAEFLCDCENEYGQLYGCYDAMCYCADNSGCDFFWDLCRDLNLRSEGEEDLFDCRKLDGDEGIEILCKNFPDRKDEIMAWVDENTKHTEGSVYRFWNGRNWETLSLEALEELAGVEIELEILDEDEDEHGLLVKDESGAEFWIYANGGVGYTKEAA